MRLGTEAMMRLCEEAGVAERLCRDVRVLTGGSGPLPDTCSQGESRVTMVGLLSVDW